MITKLNIDDDKAVGRLGNKLFIIAAGYSFSQLVGTGFLLPRWKYERSFHNVPTGTVSAFSQYREREFTYTPPIREQLIGNVTLEGYFQSDKYFSSRGDILKLLMITPEISVDEDIKSRTAIHVRRGDYLKVSHVHFNLSTTDYYAKAMESIDSKRFMIFSDDIEYCREFFSQFPYDFRYSVATNEMDDLYLMTQCKHNIIANSSFSWWGAYLNQSGGRVIMPRQWFTNDCVNSRDLHVTGWDLI